MAREAKPLAAFWSKFDGGHWTLTVDGLVVASARRGRGRWNWELKSGTAGIATTLDASMIAVGHALRHPTKD